MWKETITYTDYNDVERTEDFFFHLTKLDMLKMNKAGKFSDIFERMLTSDDGQEVADFIRDLMIESYGVKSEDGRSFIKFDVDGHSLGKEFEQTEAFDAICIKLLSDEEKFNAFTRGIVPKDVLEEADKIPQEDIIKLAKDASKTNKKNKTIKTNKKVKSLT